MSDPTQYTVSYSFGDFQSSSPNTPLPAPQLDNELANIATAVAALVAAIKDVRRPDGKLQNGSVDFAQLAPSLQLTFDPTNGALVAAAVAGAETSATNAGTSATAAANSASASANSAAASAASASSVNLSLFLPKAGNLAGIGSPDTARANIHAANVDASDMVGRLAPTTGQAVTDWNNAITSGWYGGSGGGFTANGPDTLSAWIVQVFALDANYVSQIAYNIGNAGGGTSSVTIFRRHSYNNAGVRTWQPWESMGPVPVGSTIWVSSTVAPPGFVKENGALLSRASFPRLWAFANASNNIVAEGAWDGSSFSTGDLATTFRVPDARGEFFRAYDDGRGVDSGRSNNLRQADSLKDHTHAYIAPASGAGTGTTPNYFFSSNTGATTGSPSTGAATETRPRNIVKLACIKY